jgi:hypothetical protein
MSLRKVNVCANQKKRCWRTEKQWRGEVSQSGFGSGELGLCLEKYFAWQTPALTPHIVVSLFQVRCSGEMCPEPGKIKPLSLF